MGEIISAAIAGLDLGQGVNNIIVRFSKSQYNEKIDKLNGCLKKLDEHKNKLSGYRRDLDEYWSDTKAEVYKRQVDDAIQACTNQHKLCSDQIELWQKAIETMEENNNQVNQAIDSVQGALKVLNIVPL